MTIKDKLKHSQAPLIRDTDSIEIIFFPKYSDETIRDSQLGSHGKKFEHKKERIPKVLIVD